MTESYTRGPLLLCKAYLQTPGLDYLALSSWGQKFEAPNLDLVSADLKGESIAF